MADNEIFHQLQINAPPAAIYEAITDPEKLAQWWLPATLGESETGKTVKFGVGKRGQEMLLTVLRPNELVRWRATENGFDDWVGTELEFAILPDADRTIIHFKHSKWQPGTPGFPHYSMSWAVFLLSLKELVENGKGFPYPNQWVH